MRWLLLVSPVLSHFNSALQFLVGPAPNGAVRVTSDSALDLRNGCDKQKCPSVVIFTGDQYGTIELFHCAVGQLYFFVNKSQSELGIVVQQRDGLFGALTLAQFANGSCFCYPRGDEEKARERKLLEDDAPADVGPSESGVLLCG
jgi:hypothetical protein